MFAGRPGVGRSTWKTDPACGHSASVSGGSPCVALVTKSVCKSGPPKVTLVGRGAGTGSSTRGAPVASNATTWAPSQKAHQRRPSRSISIPSGMPRNGVVSRKSSRSPTCPVSASNGYRKIASRRESTKYSQRSSRDHARPFEQRKPRSTTRCCRSGSSWNSRPTGFSSPSSSVPAQNRPAASTAPSLNRSFAAPSGSGAISFFAPFQGRPSTTRSAARRRTVSALRVSATQPTFSPSSMWRVAPVLGANALTTPAVMSTQRSSPSTYVPDWPFAEDRRASDGDVDHRTAPTFQGAISSAPKPRTFGLARLARGHPHDRFEQLDSALELERASRRGARVEVDVTGHALVEAASYC